MLVPVGSSKTSIDLYNVLVLVYLDGKRLNRTIYVSSSNRNPLFLHLMVKFNKYFLIVLN